MAIAAGELPRHRFTVEEYRERFGEDDRVELLDGDVFDMAPIGSRHNAAVVRLHRQFTEELQGRAFVQAQSPMVLSDLSMPEPDVLLARFRDDDYEEELPSVADVLLVVEVADSSWDRDRWAKVPLYVTAGVGEVWVVDVRGGAVEVFRGSEEPAVEVYPGDTVSPLAFPDVVVDVAAVLGKR